MRKARLKANNAAGLPDAIGAIEDYAYAQRNGGFGK